MVLPFYLSPLRVALLVVVGVNVLLCWWAMELLTLPPLYRQLRSQSMVLRYEPHLAVLLAVVLAAYARAAAQKLLWVCGALHRWVSTLLMVAALGMDGLMHVLDIPHPEGWWLPMLGSGAVASFIAGMLHKKKKAGDPS